MILELLREGALTLTNVGLIAPHLTEANHAALLAEVARKPKADVARIVARLHPRPDVAAAVRKLPASRARSLVDTNPAATTAVEPTPSPGLAAHRAVVKPLSPERFKLQLTMTQQTHDTLRDVQNLMRHTVPNGDLAVIVARALTLLRDHLLNQKAGQPRSRRHSGCRDTLFNAGA